MLYNQVDLRSYCDEKPQPTTLYAVVVYLSCSHMKLKHSRYISSVMVLVFHFNCFYYPGSEAWVEISAFFSFSTFSRKSPSGL